MNSSQVNVDELKKNIKSSLKEAGVQDQIRDVIRKVKQETDNSRENIEDEIFKNLKESGVLESIAVNVHVEQVVVLNKQQQSPSKSREDDSNKENEVSEEHEKEMFGESAKKDTKEIQTKEEENNKDYARADLTSKSSSESERTTVSQKLEKKVRGIMVNPKRRHLHLEIKSGKEFLEHLLDESSTSMFVLFIHFRGQRFWTQPTVCICEPTFNCGFLLELHTDASGLFKMASAGELLRISDTIHFVLIRILSCGDRQLVSSHFFEWRDVLAAPHSRRTHYLEMKGVGPESSVRVGLIEVCASLIPELAQPLSEKVISAQFTLEKSRQSERERIFLIYSKTWWREYLAIRPEHSQRAIKIFSPDENSQMRPVFQYLSVLEVGRPLLEMPREAAWFVSLILFENPSLLGTLPSSTEQWWNLHTFLCIKKGGSENHALLLCSLLLGFGLDAYVCVGTKEGCIPWLWVLTLGRNNYVTFWESTTGARYLHINPTSADSAPHEENLAYPYTTVGCVFNMKNLYAIIQDTDSVKYCNFNLKNQTLWKSMSEVAIATVRRTRAVPLLPGWTDPMLSGEDMERELRALITEHRKDLNLHTRWDVQLCHLIAPILTSYEVQHKTGVSVGREEFHEIIDTNIPDGFSFRALPMRVPAVKPRRVLALCMRDSIMNEILSCRELDLKLALRVHTYVYPEDVLSIWLIAGCKYRTRIQNEKGLQLS